MLPSAIQPVTAKIALPDTPAPTAKAVMTQRGGRLDTRERYHAAPRGQ